MFMNSSRYHTDEHDTEDALNPSEKMTADTLNSSQQATKTLQSKEAAVRSKAGDSSGDSLLDRESSQRGQGFYSPSGGSSRKQPINAQKVKKILKKRGGVIALVSLFGVSGGILASFFGPASMLINVVENFTSGNDSASVISERRLSRMINHKLNKAASEVCTAKKVKCQQGKLSNRALRRFARKGITPLDSNGKPMPLKRTGLPASNPAKYAIEVDGKTEIIDHKKLPDFLNKPENRKLAAKIYGRWGAFNMRFRAWSSKYLAKRFFSKFNIKRKGGIASLIDKKINAKERLSKVREKLPKIGDKLDDMLDGPKKKIEAGLGKAKKGGAAYVAAVGACMGIKIPGYAAAGVAAVHLAQLLPLVTDVILSPGSQMKASGLDPKYAISSEAVALIGTMLTERTKDEKTGKTLSALDSPYLLSAMGVNKARPGVSEEFAPGFSLLTNPFIQKAKTVEDASAGFCGYVLSPYVMYTALAANITSTVLASSTIIGGVLKTAGEYVFSELTGAVVKNLAGEFVKEKLKDFLKTMIENDAIHHAKGKKLGDALGIGAMAFFSSGAMARHVPVLKQSKLAAFDAIRQKNEQQQREYARASFSPFDTSNKYTFMGSLVFNLRQHMIEHGYYNNSLTSIASTIASLPAAALSFGTTASAATNFSKNYCSYAADFGQETVTEDGVDATPALNAAGLPCTGWDEQQDSMGIDEAVDEMEKAGWLDYSSNKGVEEGDDIEALVTKGVIKSDTPLADFIESCGDSSTGDYIFNAAGCTVAPQTNKTLKDVQGGYTAVKDDEKRTPDDSFGGAETASPRALAAMSVFLTDYQLHQSINGEDEEESEGEDTNSAAGGGDGNSVVEAGKQFFDYAYEWGGGHGSLQSLEATIEGVKSGSLAKGTAIFDCSGFVRASIYIAYGIDIGGGSTYTYGSNPKLTEISRAEAKPGDIAWKDDHVEIISSIEGGTIYTQGARGPEIGGPTDRDEEWTKYYRVNK